MNASIQQWIQLVKPDMKIFLWVSLGIFLFILFFQPFSIDQFDFNNRLLFVAGLGAISFILMMITRSFFPYSESSRITPGQAHSVPGLLSSLIMLALGSVAYAFYLRYVGFVEITFFVMFKVIFICLVPSIALQLSDVFRKIKHDNKTLRSLTETGSVQNTHPINKIMEKPIVFTSDNSTNNLTLLPGNVAFIRSADNYVEVFYRDDQHIIRKQLLRNTLKRIEEQINPYPDFIRCHRICIVNIRQITSLENKNQTHWLTVRGYNEQIPVSRQYLLKVKESL